MTPIDPPLTKSEKNLLPKANQKDNSNNESPVKQENLKQRAYLNSVTQFLDFGANQIVGFITNPFIVSGLGSTFYGVWSMLGQMTGYAGLADTRATQVLKWSIAKNRDIATDEALRSNVTSALIVTLIILPFVLIAGGIISWYSPHITGVSPIYYNLVRLTCAILILSLVINKLFNIFESVLRGMNLDYKRMGIGAAIVLIGGGLKIAAIQLGYGIIGLSVVQIIVAIITSLALYLIIKKHVGWFGFGKTNFSQLLNFGKLSGLFMVYASIKLLTKSDKIILGIIAGPVLVTMYAITKFTSLAVQGLVTNIVYGIFPGIGRIIGKKEYGKVGIVREQIMLLSWITGTAIGSVIIIFNESFVGLWVGDEHFAGIIANTLIVIMVLQNLLINIDSSIIHITLNIRMNVFLTFLATLISILLSLILINRYGIVGLCISLIAGRLVLSIGLPLVVNNIINHNTKFSRNKIIIPFLVSIAVFGTSYILADRIIIRSWLNLIITIPPSFIIVTLVCWILGLTSEQRSALKINLNSIKLFSKD